ncbi:MAG: hypothetical protein EOO65_03680, partial [Methanosarcinales archaeon]
MVVARSDAAGDVGPPPQILIYSDRPPTSTLSAPPLSSEPGESADEERDDAAEGDGRDATRQSHDFDASALLALAVTSCFQDEEDASPSIKRALQCTFRSLQPSQPGCGSSSSQSTTAAPETDPAEPLLQELKTVHAIVVTSRTLSTTPLGRKMLASAIPVSDVVSACKAAREVETGTTAAGDDQNLGTTPLLARAAAQLCAMPSITRTLLVRRAEKKVGGAGRGVLGAGCGCSPAHAVRPAC